VTLGPSLGANPQSPLSIAPRNTSPTRLSSLASVSPEYAPLAYIDVGISHPGKEGRIDTRALLDCGGQGSFINEPFSKTNLIPRTPKSIPIALVLADGERSEKGPVTHFNPVIMTIGGNDEPIALDITNVGHDIILGKPWLDKHDPTIRWKDSTLTFNSSYCQKHCLHYRRTIPLHTWSQTPIQDSSPVINSSIQPRSTEQGYTDSAQKAPERTSRSSSKSKSNSSSNSESKPSSKSNSKANSSPNTPRKAPQVSLIGPAAFACALKQPGAQLFLMSCAEIAELASTTIEESSSDPDLSQIPPEYHEFAEVFSKKESDKLPQHRPYDHRIELEEGATPPSVQPIYRLTPEELDVLRKYIDEHLIKGSLRPSNSPCGAPVLFVKKPDGSLRLCVDYRGLNKLTIKNRYPLPLIGELLDRLSKAKYFTKFDVRDGFNRLRIAPGEEWKTAFRCRYGLFEYTVMPFGLCNAPGTFQHYMNDTFHDFLDEFLIVYLDDLLIYSKTLKEHKQHVRKVLERLRDAGLYLKPSKCVFHVEEVTFLGFVIGPDGVKMDPAKVEAITSWPTPRSVHDIRVFLGLASFYRRFIDNFSGIVAPLTNLLKKGKRFHWDKSTQKAFEKLRASFTTAPILRHFDPSLEVILETDASDRAMGGAISQLGPDGLLHPIAFFSRKFNGAELNYEIYDKEMLAIVEAMDRYRYYFEGLGHKTTVYTDHRNLLWFTETKLYNRRQARWAEKLSRFDFVIVFRPGKQGGKPDALSRRPDYMSQEEDRDVRTMAFLKPEQVDTSLLRPETALQRVKLNRIVTEVMDIDEGLAESIRQALPADKQIGTYLNHLADDNLPRDDDVAEYLKPFSLHKDGLVLRDGLIYVPDEGKIKLQILKSCHDSKVSGHLGQAKTLEIVSRNYFWPRMRQYINEYVQTCDTCARNKTPRHTPHGQLHPLPIPAGPWQSVSMDYIVELPLSNGHNAIYVCVDRLTKMAHFCPTNSNVTAEQTAQLYLQHVFKHHGLPDNIVSDRGTQFTSKFTHRLLELCDIKSNKSTAYHPQSDGQTERVNQVLEQYLRIFCDYQQDDWCQLLPLAEFAYNNAQSSSTGASPFYANYGYHPRSSPRLIVSEDVVNPSAEELATKLQKIHIELRSQLESAQASYKEKYDRNVKEHPPFAVGDQVWLMRKNIKTSRPSQKLDVKRLGPFKILQVVGESKMAFKLELPPQMRIHPVFHASLLEPYKANTLSDRVQPAPPPILIENELEYVVEQVLDSKIDRGRLKYYIDWEGYPPEDRTWEPISHLENAKDAVAQFHSRYPNRPSPTDLPRSNRSTRLGVKGRAGARPRRGDILS
jgi:Reverse transcriptase (RNA-dependent DNA polymerase)/RNase H-like domain found in reverse transcriptase/Integrase zinc binding domain/Chromo (CHRromatin Organisation MOdifier) domain/Integrase core domain